MLGTPGIGHYWRLGEASGTSLADAAGSASMTSRSGVTLGVPGALSGDSDTAARFNGTSGAAQADVDLSATNKVTVEFWLKWNAYANDDRLAVELTSNFNQNDGGFIVDPNDSSGKFAVGLGRPGSTRNNVLFNRPSAGSWHHYAFVLDTSAPAATQITPYVDGAVVPYTKVNAGAGAGNFANATLNVMSRNAASLFGAGDLDELALYTTALSAATIAGHYTTGTSQAPNAKLTAAFTATPSPATTGQQVSSTRRAPATATAPSPSTNGTSTATAPTRPTPAPPPPPPRPTPLPATSPSACASPTTRRHRHHQPRPHRPGPATAGQRLRPGRPRHSRPQPLLAAGRGLGHQPHRPARHDAADRPGRRHPRRARRAE
ncbi:MAG: LamG domain-containing protein [Solirubrobacterales bacterium]